MKDWDISRPQRRRLAGKALRGRYHCCYRCSRLLCVCHPTTQFQHHANFEPVAHISTRKVWDTHTGECLHTLQHSHIVRAVAFPVQAGPQILATGGMEKKLRIFDLSRAQGSSSSSPTSQNAANGASSSSSSSNAMSYEIGPGVHNGTIKSIIWYQDYNILVTAADDKKIRWWDLRSRHPCAEYSVDGTIGSCEMNAISTTPNDPGVLSVAAGKSAYFFDPVQPGRLLKKTDFSYELASVAVNKVTSRFVTGSTGDTWARVYDLESNDELGVWPLFSWLISI